MMLTGGADTFTLSSVGDQAIGVIGTANTYINILKPFITNRLNHIISILLYIFVDKIQARKSNKSPFSH